ncbi:MAG: hypothetical protein ABIU05_10625 [Nitrospirales bacterium]
MSWSTGRGSGSSATLFGGTPGFAAVLSYYYAVAAGTWLADLEGEKRK